ncbi:MAG: hypothetical protein IPL94_04720 [Tetrasphaera sp.]|nr:hypothetical protein [Tetrasphaera sp.]
MPARPDSGPVVIDGDRCHVIDDVDAIAPFMVSLTSVSDVWAFLTSNGGITAGRRSSDHAIFPYFTEDLVRDASQTTGSATVITGTDAAGQPVTWEPFGPTHPNLPRVHRAMMKTDLGDVVHLQETHDALGLTFRVTWRVSPRFGLVRTATLEHAAPGHATPSALKVVDGILHVLPPGVTARTQRELGQLLDAYKVTELDPTGLAWVRLNARLTDRAEASESLLVTTMWEHGLPQPERRLSATSLRRWEDHPVIPARGERAAYLSRASVTLQPGAALRWMTTADINLDAADLVALRRRLAEPGELVAAVEEDIAASRTHLRRLVGSADGFTVSGDRMADAHHASSTMFNIMRGGVPARADAVERDDVCRFLTDRNRAVAQRWADLLAALPDRLSVTELRAAAAASGDGDLARVVGEYVPLTFSRRHGDPSRPWNVFEIVVTDAAGKPQLAHQGNWRDIFQNWEALAWSFPEYTESFVRTFLNATTRDGYNPYRISRSGVDWEVPEPENPWSNIGYWSDHQIVYLGRLLELLVHQHPQRLAEMARSEQFVHVDVPYSLATYAELLVDPQDSVTFDEPRHARAMERVAELGGDGRLVTDDGGELVRSSLTEKLLILLAAKLFNFVPDGGIWMNTQRPEWNDANNALVGRGLSVVTVGQLHRFLQLLQRVAQELPLEVSAPVAAAMETITSVLRDGAAGHDIDGDRPLTDAARRSLLDALGAAGTTYREAIATPEQQPTVTLDRALLTEHLDLARRWMARTVRRARRADGLYHSYNLLHLTEGHARVDHLDEMLEGQVAALSSGVLDDAAVDALLAALPASRLYRSDVRSYQLYPEVEVPTFLGRNTINGVRWRGNGLLAAMAERGDRRIIVVDDEGEAHFAGALRNADDVREVLGDAADDEDLRALVDTDGAGVLEIFEEVFRHAGYTGRSSSFFAYEGVGSIYWHMVSKLLLAVREQVDAAQRAPARDAARLARLHTAYDAVRAGLGFSKTAHEFGAFPHDAYSHTPSGRGARQPGMTGQVKEDMLARWADFGVGYVDGRIRIDTSIPAESDWSTSPQEFSLVAVGGQEELLDLPPGSIGLTMAQTPILMRRNAHGGGHGQHGQVISVFGADGGLIEQTTQSLLSPEVSAQIMSRSARVARVEATRLT